MFSHYCDTPLIPAVYGGIYRSTFSTLLTICVLCYILTSMCYTDSLMDGAGAHPPLLLHTIVTFRDTVFSNAGTLYNINIPPYASGPR